MICPHCKHETSDSAKFCKNCGASVQQEAAPSIPVPPIPTPPVPPIPTPPMPTAVIPTPPAVVTEDMLPEQYRPLSPWAYFGLSLLFSVPIVGFVFLIIFSFKRSNIHRRNFARSYWCALLVAVAIALLAVILVLALGGSLGALYG